MNKKIFIFLLIAVLLGPAFIFARDFNPGSLDLPEGYQTILYASGLDAPTMVAFDNQNRVLVAESGYGGSGTAKIVRIELDGSQNILVQDLPDKKPITSVAWHDTKVYFAHGGTISTFDTKTNQLQDIITGLPANGDYPIGQIVFTGTVMYFSVGSATNAGTAKPNAPQDIACAPSVIKCNAAILKANIDGSDLSVYATGLRFVYGLIIGPDNQLYGISEGMEPRGPNPVTGGFDCLYQIQQGQWYGWPDYNCDTPLKPQPKQSGKSKVQSPPAPIAKIDWKNITGGFAFAPSNDWGETKDIYAAMAGNSTVSTIDTDTGKTKQFASGFSHPTSVTFGPDGSMYVTDVGPVQLTSNGLQLSPHSGAIWKISKNYKTNAAAITKDYGLSLFAWVIQILLFGIATFLLARKKGLSARTPAEGLKYGFLSALVMLVLMMLISPLFGAKVFSGAQIFDFFLRSANVAAFNGIAFVSGIIVELVIGTVFGLIYSQILRTESTFRIILSAILYGFTCWAVLQYAILPRISLLSTDRALPPSGFFTAFIVYGLSLGWFFEQSEIKKTLRQLKAYLV